MSLCRTVAHNVWTKASLCFLIWPNPSCCLQTHYPVMVISFRVERNHFLGRLLSSLLLIYYDSDIHPRVCTHSQTVKMITASIRSTQEENKPLGVWYTELSHAQCQFLLLGGYQPWRIDTHLTFYNINMNIDNVFAMDIATAGCLLWRFHYSNVIMGSMGSEIYGVSIVYSTVCPGADQRKHQSSAPLAFVKGIYRWPVNSLHKVPVTLKMFPFDDVIMRHNGVGLLYFVVGETPYPFTWMNNHRSYVILSIFTHCAWRFITRFELNYCVIVVSVPTRKEIQSRAFNRWCNLWRQSNGRRSVGPTELSAIMMSMKFTQVF